MDIKASLTDALNANGYKLNGVTPYVVAERPPHLQQKFAVFGKMAEAVKKANEGKTGQQVVIEPRYCAIFIQTDGQDKPKCVGEVRDGGVMAWEEDNCKALLSKNGAEIMVSKTSY